MNNSILKLSHILDNVPLTTLQRAEANNHLAQIGNKFNELSEQLEALRGEIQQLKDAKNS